MERVDHGLLGLCGSGKGQPDLFLTQPLSTAYLGSRREEGASGEGPIFEAMANTPFIPTIRPGGVRRELAVVDPHGRFVRWLANKP